MKGLMRLKKDDLIKLYEEKDRSYDKLLSRYIKLESLIKNEIPQLKSYKSMVNHHLTNTLFGHSIDRFEQIIKDT